MTFRISGLNPSQFRHLFGLSDDELAAVGARRCIADAKPGFPDRIEVRDAEPGETLILLNYEHQPANTPYRSAHAIFVLENATTPLDVVDTIPDVMRVRMMSLRGFTRDGEMVNAELVDGGAMAASIERLFNNPSVDCIHAHYATRGCYAARIDRA